MGRNIADQNYSSIARAASVVAAFTSPGSTPNVIATMLVVLLSLSAISPLLSPTAVVATLKDNVAQVEKLYENHRLSLNESTDFKGKVVSFKDFTLALEGTCIEAWKDVSFMDYRSWAKYLSHSKYVYTNARAQQRKVEVLKNELELAIVGAERGRLQAFLRTQGLDSNGSDEGIHASESGDQAA
ncbi:hypothetical protein EDD85DRAFT_830722 [Armillaria nabsnona]|nr:hypothetical protein EDD85DRAFT_830722 [Armillaria nabsnona]